MARKLNDGECVDLSDAFAFGLDQDLLLQYFILDAFSKVAFAPQTTLQHGLHLFSANLFTFTERGGFAKLASNPEHAQRQGFLVACITRTFLDQQRPGVS